MLKNCSFILIHRNLRDLPLVTVEVDISFSSVLSSALTCHYYIVITSSVISLSSMAWEDVICVLGIVSDVL